MASLDLNQPVVMEPGCVYLVRLMEHLNLPEGVSGKANPKSTTGRLDIFTRLITDYGDEFEKVAVWLTDPTPRSFHARSPLSFGPGCGSHSCD